MLAVIVSGSLGALAALVACWHSGLVALLLCVPLAGSSAALLCGLYIGYVRAQRSLLIARSEDTSLLSLSQPERARRH